MAVVRMVSIMSREIKNKPHPTPNPDGPHSADSSRAVGAGAPVPQAADLAADDLAYDSCMDDLNIILSQPVSEPDPALKSKSSSETIPSAWPDQDLVSAHLQKTGKQPKTAEIFTKGFGLQAGKGVRPPARAVKTPSSSSSEISPDHETVFEGNPQATGLACPDFEPEPRALELASDDDQIAESRVRWSLLLLMSYSSAVTLALTWVLWTGRAIRTADSSSSNTSQNEAESVSKPADQRPLAALPPLPGENIGSLGKTLRIGDLEVTPVGVVVAPLNLVRSIKPSKRRREESPSLVLRLKLRNISTDHTFAPLERAFVREQTSALDRSSVRTLDDQCIKLFPLALESEWSIVGQEFPVLEPGNSVETLIGTEPGAADRLTGEATWRVRLRIGPYRSDVIGVRFDKNDVTR
jgi:hypothetical protein